MICKRIHAYQLDVIRKGKVLLVSYGYQEAFKTDAITEVRFVLVICVFVFKTETRQYEGQHKHYLEIDWNKLAAVENFGYSSKLQSRASSMYFIEAKSRIFTVFNPGVDPELSCLLIHCLYKDRLVPISGNCPFYPGLYIMKNNTMLLDTETSKGKHKLYTISFVGYGEDNHTKYEVQSILFTQK